MGSSKNHTAPILVAAVITLLAIGWLRSSFQPVSADSLNILGPYSAATNHSDDLEGTADDRPGTWGKAGFSVHKYHFSPPAGYRVRVLRVYGDLSVFTRKPDYTKCAGALWGLGSTAPEGSTRMTFAADNTFVSVQDSICGGPRSRQFDYDTQVGGLLGPDNVMTSKVAVWLSDVVGSVHLEPTFVVQFRYERQ